MNEFETNREPFDIAGGLSLFPIRQVRKERVAVGREKQITDLIRRRQLELAR